MLTQHQVISISKAVAAFFARIDSIPGIDPNKIVFSMPLEICGNHVVIEETPSAVTVKYPEFTHDFQAKPSKEVLAAAIKAYEHTSAEEQNFQTAQTLVASMADKGYVYVQDMRSEVIDLFLRLWSDAYGEDRPEMFVKEFPLCGMNEKSVTGFIKTRLTPADIAAKNNEDGDDDYNPEPLFPANKMKEDKHHA